MADFFAGYFVPLMMFAVLCALGLGIYSMLRGGDFARSYSNRLMRWRVGLQAAAVLAILLTVYLRGDISF